MKYSIHDTEREFNTDTQIACYTDYARYGLWSSEKIIFSEFLSPKDKILDVGCGAGRTTLGLSRLGFKNIIGLDLSQSLIMVAKKLARESGYNIKYMVGNALNLQYPDSSFDKCIFSYNGMMGIPNEKNRCGVAKEISRILRPGGLFIFTTPDREQNLKYKDFWSEERARWDRCEQDSRLHDYGDRLYDSTKEGVGFMHCPNLDEVNELIAYTGFLLVYNKMRSDICETPCIEKDWFGEVRFYVVKKRK